MGDMTRMREVLGFTPQYTPEETVREFASTRRVRRLLGKQRANALDEDRLRDTINRRRCLREQAGERRTRRRAARGKQGA